MLCARILPFPVVVAVLLGACVSLARGADKVHLTKNASDISGCTAAGNISVPRDSTGQVDLVDAEAQFRNQVIGLGANTGFITSGPLGIPAEGVAYRCPN